MEIRATAFPELKVLTPRRFGDAEAIFARSGWRERPAVAVATHEWPTKALRLANSVLDCRAIVAACGIAQPDWRPALDR